jgi:DNA primase
VAPIEPVADWDDVKTFATTVAQTMAKERPDRYVWLRRHNREACTKRSHFY